MQNAMLMEVVVGLEKGVMSIRAVVLLRKMFVVTTDVRQEKNFHVLRTV